MFAVLVMVMLAFLAIGVDLGQGYLERRTNQNAADAGSVAGMRALVAGDNDQTVQTAIRHVLDNTGFSDGSLVFLSANNSTPGTDVSKVYVNAQYGTYNSPAVGVCTPLSSNQWVGSNGNNPPPSGANCIRVGVSTNKATLFGNIPLIGAANIGASATSSAAQISLMSPSSMAGANGAAATATPTPGPFVGPNGFGYAIWGGKRADTTVLSIGSPVLFFADSGWDYGNDVYESCSSNCEYNPNGESYKGYIDSPCGMPTPVTSISCIGPKGALGNEPQHLAVGSYVGIVVLDYLQGSGNHVNVTVIGWATVQVLASCPTTPGYLTGIDTGQVSNGVCGTIVHLDGGKLNEGDPDPTTATPTPTSMGFGNVGSG